MIYLSQAAIGEVKRLQSKHQVANGALRLKVRHSGCSGLSYQMEFEQQVRPSDQIYEFQGMRVVIDPQSFSCVRGLTVDYSEDLMGGAFRFENPNAAQLCACGNSFAIVSEQDRAFAVRDNFESEKLGYS